MNNEIAMIIDMPFNVPRHPFWPEFENMFEDSKIRSQTKEWIDYRIGIFIKYTANSLIHQTNQNFTCIVRHTKKTKELILDALSKYPKLPDNIIFTDNADELIENIIYDYRYIYHIRLDSDNMYSPDYIDQLYSIKYYEGLQCILSKKGYIYESNKNILAHMNHPSPSFYALVYTVDDYLVGFNHYVSLDHWGAANLVHETIPTPSYMVIVHGNNLDNDFQEIIDYPYVETKFATDEEKSTIFDEFNLI